MNVKYTYVRYKIYPFKYRPYLDVMPINLLKKYTIGEYIRQVESSLENKELFFGHGTSNALDEAAYIVLTITERLPVMSEDIYQVVVTESQQKKISKIVDRRIKEKVPAAYLLQEAWFAGLRFYVNEDVLVPRSPFAELIGDLFSPWVDYEKTLSILDLCTGSGCIGIAAAKAFPHAQVDVSDVSEKALVVTKENIKRHDLEGRVIAIKSDLYAGLAGKKYDLIMSNPPYVCIEEVESLPTEYRNEPRLGLDGGESGLDLVHYILAFAPEHLHEQGVIFVEVGSSAETLEEFYPMVPFLWQDFEYGGDGVFMLTKSQLVEYHQEFVANTGSVPR